MNDLWTVYWTLMNANLFTRAAMILLTWSVLATVVSFILGPVIESVTTRNA